MYDQIGRVLAPAFPSRLCLALALATTFGPATRATTVRRLNLEELTLGARTVVVARCVETRPGVDAASGIPVQESTFEVQRAVKGASPGRLMVRQPSETGFGRAGISGVPGFVPGEEVVLFLYGESTSGMRSPVGLGQGKFSIRRDKNGRAVVRNALGNRGLLDGLSPGAKGRLGVTPAPDPTRLTLDDLLELVERLLEPDRRRP